MSAAIFSRFFSGLSEATQWHMSELIADALGGHSRALDTAADLAESRDEDRTGHEPSSLDVVARMRSDAKLMRRMAEEVETLIAAEIRDECVRVVKS